MTVALMHARAFAVWFRDLGRWDPSFFRRVRWTWPQSVLRPISEALSRETREVATEENKEHLPIIEKISFGGAVSLLDDPASRKKYKGRLFWANAGDLVYSKIRVKQGSLAVVPASIPRMAVSAEYPVYSVKADVARGPYLNLALRSSAFQSYLDGLAHGGSTKTRIHPSDFERLTIPIPPLPVQEAIVEHWRKAHEAAAKSRDTIAALEAECEGSSSVPWGFALFVLSTGQSSWLFCGVTCPVGPSRALLTMLWGFTVNRRLASDMLASAT